MGTMESTITATHPSRVAIVKTEIHPHFPSDIIIQVTTHTKRIPGNDLVVIVTPHI